MLKRKFWIGWALPVGLSDCVNLWNLLGGGHPIWIVLVSIPFNAALVPLFLAAHGKVRSI